MKIVNWLKYGVLIVVALILAGVIFARQFIVDSGFSVKTVFTIIFVLLGLYCILNGIDSLKRIKNQEGEKSYVSWQKLMAIGSLVCGVFFIVYGIIS